jgi:aspartate racemase
MKRLGVIGGLGPMATAVFLEMIVEMTDAKTDQEHIEVLLHSMPRIPDRTKFILGESNDSPMPYFIDMGRKLSNDGADIIAIPCITAHFFQKELEKNLGCTVINTIVETANYLKAEGISRVGIMATDGTIKSKLFQNVLCEYGIECVLPDYANQKNVMNIIYGNVKAGIPADMDVFNMVSRSLFNGGAQKILLGCTELSVVRHKNGGLSEKYLDVMEVLARKSIIECGTLKDKYIHLF